jgi:hypothetical protein
MVMFAVLDALGMFVVDLFNVANPLWGAPRIHDYAHERMAQMPESSGFLGLLEF